MDNENNLNMIQWTIWYNVQYSIIAYNITIQYNRQLVQYQTIDNIIQCTMITIWYNIQWIQYTIRYNMIQYYNNTSEFCGRERCASAETVVRNACPLTNRRDPGCSGACYRQAPPRLVSQHTWSRRRGLASDVRASRWSLHLLWAWPLPACAEVPM